MPHSDGLPGPVVERRRPSRKRAQLRGLAVSRDGTKTVDCRIEDISALGARVSFNKGKVIPEQLYLIVAGREAAHEAVVAWAGNYECGLSFTQTHHLETLNNSELQFLRRLKLERLRS